MANSPLTVALTGASGLQYGFRLIECLVAAGQEVYVLVSPAAHAVAALELGITLPKQSNKLNGFLREKFQAKEHQITVFDQLEWTSPIASGSHIAQAMIICPCSSGTLAGLATGISNNLIERAGDVMLKERRKLILVPRETPISQIHLENMLKLVSMGVVMIPASPGFYHQPQSIDDLIDFIVARILDHLAIPHQLIKRWGIDL